MKKKTSAGAKLSGKPEIKDLQVRETKTIKGGVSNVLKTRHDTVKNSIGN